ncbi:MAG TPA: hypothetical protein PLZ32_16775, partial [Saprospiraceae bacterium]|nr:hypothetical protein [Saprospiraceae bacterium]
EIGGRKSEIGGRKSEIGGRKSEIGGPGNPLRWAIGCASNGQFGNGQGGQLVAAAIPAISSERCAIGNLMV